MSSNYVQIGTRVITRDSYDCPTREMGSITGTIVALRINLLIDETVSDEDQSSVELAVIWDRQTDANPLDPSDGVDYEWVPLSEVVVAQHTTRGYL
jgi:hypothetical protein